MTEDTIKTIVINTDLSWTFPVQVRKQAIDLYPQTNNIEFWDASELHPTAKIKEQREIWGNWPRFFVAGSEDQGSNTGFSVQSELLQMINSLGRNENENLAIVWIFNRPDDINNNNKIINSEILDKISHPDILSKSYKPRIWRIAVFRDGGYDKKEHEKAYSYITSENENYFDTVFFITEQNDYSQKSNQSFPINFSGLRIVCDIIQSTEEGKKHFKPQNEEKTKPVYWIKPINSQNTRPRALRELITFTIDAIKGDSEERGRKGTHSKKDRDNFEKSVNKIVKSINLETLDTESKNIVNYVFDYPFIEENKLVYFSGNDSINIEKEWRDYNIEVDKSYKQRTEDITEKIGVFQTNTEYEISQKIKGSLNNFESLPVALVGADQNLVDNIIEVTSKEKERNIEKCGKIRKKLFIKRGEERGFRNYVHNVNDINAPRYLKEYIKLEDSIDEAKFWSRHILGRTETIVYFFITICLFLAIPFVYQINQVKEDDTIISFMLSLFGQAKDNFILSGFLPILTVVISYLYARKIKSKYQSAIIKVKNDSNDLGKRLGEITSYCLNFIRSSTRVSWINLLLEHLKNLKNLKNNKFKNEYEKNIKTAYPFCVTEEDERKKFKKNIESDLKKKNTKKWMKFILPRRYFKKSENEISIKIDDHNNSFLIKTSYIIRDDNEIQIIKKI